MDETVEEAAPLQYPRATTAFAACACVVFIAAGVSGNLLTMVALARSAKLRSATTAFVASLAAADLLFCALCLPPTASRYIHHSWVLGETLCKLFPFFFYGNVAASLLSMTAITINRYVLISHPRLYGRVYRPRHVALMICACWLLSFVLLAPTLAGAWGEFGYRAQSFSCTILRRDGRSPKKFLFALGFLLPCLIIVASYSCIFYRVHQSRKNVEAHCPAGSGPQSGVRQDEIRLTRMMLIIFCSFLVCFLPLMVVNVLEDKIRSPTVHVLASVLAWMSSCINPVIYAAMNRQYRQAYARLFCRRRRSSSASAHRRSSSSGGARSGSRTLMSEVFALSAAPKGGKAPGGGSDDKV